MAAKQTQTKTPPPAVPQATGNAVKTAADETIVPQGNYAETVTVREKVAHLALDSYRKYQQQLKEAKKAGTNVAFPFTWAHDPDVCAVAAFAAKVSWQVCAAIDTGLITANQAFADAWALYSAENAGYKQQRHASGSLKRPNSRVRTLNLKFYDEQLPFGFDDLRARVALLDPKEWEVFVAKHDSDTDTTSDFWLPANKKTHYHLVIRRTDNGRFKILPVLDMLGIYYRVMPQDRGYIVSPTGAKAWVPFPDLELWCRGGVTTCGDFCSAVLYLTHETQRARMDGKYQYDFEGPEQHLWTNVSRDRYMSVRDGALASREGTKATTREMMHLDTVARDLGRRLGNFDFWADNLDWKFRTNAKFSQLRKSYDVGVKEAVERLNASGILRTCVFIQGPPGVGKTYAVHQALLALGLAEAEIYEPTATGTGKYDELAPYHKAIALDDNSGSAILPMTDNYPCRVYRRGSGDRYWLGSYYVATSNLCFHDWAAPSVLRQAPKAKPSSTSVVGRLNVVDGESDEDEALMDAALSRFYLVRVVPHGDTRPPTVSVDVRCRRGTSADIAARDAAFDAFLRVFRRSITEKWLLDHGCSAEDMAAYLRFVDAAAAVDGVVRSPELHLGAEVSVAASPTPQDPHALIVTTFPPKTAGPGTSLAFGLDDGAHDVTVTFAHPVAAVDADSRQAARDYLAALDEVPTCLASCAVEVLSDMAPSRLRVIGYVLPTAGTWTDTIAFAPPGCVDDPPAPDMARADVQWLGRLASRMVFPAVVTRVMAEVAA